MADLTQILIAAGRADRQAEHALDEWLQRNYGELACALAAEIATEGKDMNARQMASIYLKNTLNAKSSALQKEKHARWKQLDGNVRRTVKESLLQAMRSQDPAIPHIAAVAAAEVASVELPFQEWPEFVPTHMENARTHSQPGQQEFIAVAAYECLGFAAERIAEIDEIVPGDVPELPATTVDSMLTTIVDGVQAARSDAIRLAALQALKNSLQFVRKNMEVKAERDFLMTAVCQASSATDARVRALSFACMDTIAEFYYEKMQDYMKVIFNITLEAIKQDADEQVKINAIEFWVTVAYMEQSFLDEETTSREEGLPLDRPPCPKYVQAAMEQLVPLLLETLTQQDEDAEVEDFNLQAAGGVCLEAVSQTVESLIVPVVIPFVQQHINSENWRLRDAAIVAFASILDGPSTETIGTAVGQAVPVLLTAFQDGHVMVRDSATHCIAKICRFHIHAIQGEMVHNVIKGLITKLQESPRVAAHSCTAIFNIAMSLKSEQPQDTNLLSAPMFPLMQALMAAADREDAVECHLRVSSMAAAAELITSSASDCTHIFKDLLPVIGQRMDHALKMQVVSSDDRDNQEQLLGMLSGLLTALFQRLARADVEQLTDNIMGLALQILQVRNATCHEEALLTIGAIAVCLEDGFAKYLEAFMPLLVAAIRSFQEQSLCQVAVGVVVDVCGAVGGHVQPFCDQVMQALMDILRDASAHRDIKPIVISCFGDVAMAIGRAYEPYLQLSVMLLMQASQQVPTQDSDDEFVSFINSLRLSILEAYSQIILGLADGNALDLFVPNVPSVIQFLQYLATPESQKDEAVLKQAVALLGDICQEMSSQSIVRQQLVQPFSGQLVQQAFVSADPSVREIAVWAQQMLQAAQQQQA